MSVAVVPELDRVVPAAGQQDVFVERMIDDGEHASPMTVHLVVAVPETSSSLKNLQCAYYRNVVK